MPNLVVFNGSNDYLTHAALSGFVNGKELTVAGWLNPTADNRKIFTGTTGASERITVDILFGTINVLLRNAAGTAILQQATVSTDMVTRGLFHFCVTVNLATSETEIYIDGIADGDTPSLGPLDENIDLTVNNWKICAAGNNSAKYAGEIFGLWIDPNHISAAQAANFITPDGFYVDLGTDGSNPTGTAPNMYFQGDYLNFGDNTGSTGAANDFTVSGAPTDGTPLSEGVLVDVLAFNFVLQDAQIAQNQRIFTDLLTFNHVLNDVDIVEDVRIQADTLIFNHVLNDINLNAANNIPVDLFPFDNVFLDAGITGDEIITVDLLTFSYEPLSATINANDNIPVDLLPFSHVLNDVDIVEDLRIQVDTFVYTPSFLDVTIAGFEGIPVDLLVFTPSFLDATVEEGQPITRRVQQSVIGDYVVLFEIDATAIGSQKFYFTQNVYATGPVFWQSNEYTPIEIEAEGFEISGAGALPTPNIRISNVTKIMSSIVIGFGDLVGAKITRWRTLKEYLDDGTFPDPNAHLPPDVFFIDRKTKHNKFMIEWKLSAVMDQEGTKLPRRQILRDTCTFIYRTYNPTSGELEYNGAGNQCPYVGNDANPPETSGPFFDAQGNVTTIDSDKCGKKLSDCKKRFVDATNNVNDPIPGRFFPSVGRNRV